MAEKKNLITKLAEVQAELTNIPKNGYNEFHKYKFVREADVADAVRDKFAEKNMMMVPDIVETTHRETTTARGKVEYIVQVKIVYTIYDGDSDQTLQFTFYGDGQDSGDKAIYKAITGAQKYAMMKLFNIATGEDPENNSSADKEEGKAQNGPKQGATERSQGGNGNLSKEDKEKANKEFFARKDEITLRVKNLALKTEGNSENIHEYLITKANEIDNKNYKNINSINIDTVEKLLIALEQRSESRKTK